ncbi:ALG-1 [Caenorhabditis elegans]|uniref:ALG-1 n=1 Tax=Caenorhabditis elegans TaxID=6239 RepID=A0A2C9C358_CAEEL|nr:ALG-1 [Caenorhabditis elegans]SOF58698.1 ALG-1 [Caenorhabditis elegans]|eukprot:NP_001343708.1 ALG-1 INteracting protein [Caenorhabditis elegans]
MHGYQGNDPNYRRQPPYRQLHVDTRSPSSYSQQYVPYEADPGMNGDGWQGPGRGGPHHMNGGGGGRRGGGGGMHNQRIQQNPHHGGMNRMMPHGFRPQQGQFMPQYPPPPPMGGMPDVMDINMRMDGMSLGSTPSGIPGQYGDMGPPPVQQWNQPAPFVPPPQQDDLYDPSGYGGGAGGGGGHHPSHMPPYGQRGNNQNQYGNRMQGGQGGYRGNQQRQQQQQPQQGFNMPPMMVPPGQPPFYGGNQPNHHHQQPSFAPSPFSMGGGGGGSQGGPHEQHGPGGNQNGGFGVSSSSMDDYSMWTDENDEDAKKKKSLRDKGLSGWGDADVSNSKPIRRWIVPEGQEEDFETAMERCPSHLKKKALNEEALRRRLTSENPQIVAQAQQQAEEEANAMMRIGRRPIVPSGWGDIPSEISTDKSDSEFDQSSSRGWDEGSISGGGSGRHPSHHQSNDNSMWNSPSVGGGQSNSETRNPFFAQHMQQQQHQQQHQPHYGGSSMVPPHPTMGVGSSASSSSIPIGMLMMSGSGNVGGGPPSSSSLLDEDGSQKKLAENLKLAVQKGHLDISLLSLPHIPPNVLDLLTEILAVIPRLDDYEDELKKLGENRPSNYDEGASKEEKESWMSKDQKNDHDKAVIGVVTAKIEVTQLSKKITEALIEAGLLPPQPQTSTSANTSTNHLNHRGGPPPGSDGGAGPSTSRSGGGGAAGGDSFNSSGGGGPPDHYYDYSFLG